ncbi:hypothetical protein BBJ28_00021008 [Nothophytophthora sp. Chile5]|nr:hypothetical protein BBJ28_00021008 [Nothophytophthora sp. Chile5]
MKQLLHFTGDAIFTQFSLCTSLIVFCTFACWTYGIAVPSGPCVPSQLSGAAYCWICVMIVLYLGFPVGAQVGMFALIGSASMLGCMSRMTISLTVILLECTGVIEWGLPNMVSLMVTRWMVNSFNEGIYDTIIFLNHLPFLKTATTPGSPWWSRGVHRAILEAKRKSSRFAGITNLHHPFVLLQRKVYFIEKPEPLVRTPEGDTTLLYNDQSALSRRDLEGSYPRYPSIHRIQLDERDMWMELPRTSRRGLSTNTYSYMAIWFPRSQKQYSQ